MVLWTPNPRTVDPVRVCPRCEGFVVEQDHRDMRRYLSLHRLCCCCVRIPVGECPSTIEMTISGVDASKCSTCHNSGGDYKMKSISVDGTYTLNQSGSSCTYNKPYTDGDAPSVVYTTYSSFDYSCTGGPTDTTAYVGMTVTLQDSDSDCATSSYVGVDPPLSLFVLFLSNETVNVGDTVSNDLTDCTAGVSGFPNRFPGSTGGTVSISL